MVNRRMFREFLLVMAIDIVDDWRSMVHARCRMAADDIRAGRQWLADIIAP